ncbi:DNA ligase [Diplonema papillatum]|nr:DNA ligase [Diplonema papillatum]
MATLAGIDKLKKPELLQLCEERSIEPPRTVADMRYVLKKAFEEEEGTNGKPADGDAAKSPKKQPVAPLAKPKGSLTEVAGDFVQPKGTGKRLLVHSVAKGLNWSPKGTMGRITQAFGQEPRVAHDALAHTLKIGSVQFVSVAGDNTVASVLCQTKPPPGQVPPLNVAALTKGLKSVADTAKKEGASVHIAKLDPRTPGYDSDAIDDAIQSLLVDEGLSVYLYARAPGGSTPTVQKPVKGKKKRDESESEEESAEPPPKKKKKKKAKVESSSEEEEEASEEKPKKKKKAANPKKSPPGDDGSELGEPPCPSNRAARRKYILKKIQGKTLDDFPLTHETAKVIVTKVDKDSEEFWELEEKFNANLQGRNEDYVGKRIKKGLKPIRFILIGADRLDNELLECRFELTKQRMLNTRDSKDCRERVSFHGTHPKNCLNICKTSLLRFKHALNPCKKQVDDGYFGSNKKGVYVSRYADYTLKYANNVVSLEPKDSVKTILFRTLPGKSKHMTELCGAVDPTPGFDSHSSPEYLEWYLFDEAQLCPEYVLEVRAEEDTRTKSDDQ